MMAPEAFLVWCPELGSGPEDGRQILATDAERAAKIWAEREDSSSADYWIVGGGGTIVVVQAADGSCGTFRVTGEPTIQYTARPA